MTESEILDAETEKKQIQYVSNYFAECYWEYYLDRTSGVFDLIHRSIIGHDLIVGQFWCHTQRDENVLNILTSNSGLYLHFPVRNKFIPDDFTSALSAVTGINLSVYINGKQIWR